jgi:hypothetical protein
VLVHRVDSSDGSVVFLHNLSDADQVVDVSRSSGLEDAEEAQELFADGRGKDLAVPLGQIDLPAYGYRWIRLLR